MKIKNIMESERGRSSVIFAAFAAVFALAAIWVFWGAWSPDFAIVSPDDGDRLGSNWMERLAAVWNDFAENGKFHPLAVIWDSLIASAWYLKELRYASALFLAALATAYFLRGRGLSRVAAYAGGLFLAFSGYWCTLYSAGHAGIFIWMSYGLFAFGLIDRAVSTGKLRYWLLLGVTEAWGCYSQPDIWLLFAFFAAMWYLFAALRAGFSKRIFHGTFAAAAAFALVGAPGVRHAFGSALAGRDEQIKEGQTLSAAKQGEVSEEEKRWIFCTNWSLPPAETAEFFTPRLNGDTSCPLTLSIGTARGVGVKPYTGAIGRPLDAKEGNYRQHSVYLGRVTCLFALFALISLFFKRDEKAPDRAVILFFAFTALFFCLCSFGRYFTTFYSIIFALPFGDSLRAPVKWLHLTEFSVAVLAGFGVEAALRVAGARKGLIAALAALVVFGVCDLAYNAHFYCAPIDMREARRANCSRQMTVLRRGDFSRPEVQRMVSEKRIVSQAHYIGNPDLYLVDVLTPRKASAPKFKAPAPLPFSLGVVSVLSALLICAYASIRTCPST